MRFAESKPPRTAGLHVLDPALPLLAAEVAVEADNLLAGRSKDRAAMRDLASRLRVLGSDRSDSRLDWATSTVLGEAVWETFGVDVSEIRDLLERAKSIADSLANADPGKDRSQLEEARDFCVALSRAAAAYSQSIKDLRPPHPFRR